MSMYLFLPAKTKKYDIVRTCDFGPEQYDVFLADSNEKVAYIRERWKNLTVECPECNGQLVFQAYLTKEKDCVKAFEKEIFEAIDDWLRGKYENI